MRGGQYQTAIFYHSDKQKNWAQESKAKLEKSGLFKDPIVTKILPAARFYPAEDYHQDFHLKSPGRYKSYRSASGRDEFLEKAWGKGKKT